MATVFVSGHLKDYTGNKREFHISDAGTISDLILKLNGMFPGIQDRIFDEHDETRPFVNIFVNGENIREGEKERTKLKDKDTVHILPSVAGG